MTAATVAQLLREQHPDIAHLPIRPAGAGWDNQQWRLGDHLAVRLPVRAATAELIRHEQRWLPVLAQLLPVDIPVPVRLGVPSSTFTMPWSVVPWFAAETAGSTPVPSRTAWAHRLAEVMIALHCPAPPDAPANPFRGIDLDRDPERFSARVAALGSLSVADRASLQALRAELVTADRWTGQPLWLHGDPHPANLLVHAGTLRAVIDFGDLTAGDPASDLATAWLTFDTEGRRRFMRATTEACGWDEDTWARARAWALHIAVALLSRPQEHPHLVPMGQHALTEAMAG